MIGLFVLAALLVTIAWVVIYSLKRSKSRITEKEEIHPALGKSSLKENELKSSEGNQTKKNRIA